MTLLSLRLFKPTNLTARRHHDGLKEPTAPDINSISFDDSTLAPSYIHMDRFDVFEEDSSTAGSIALSGVCGSILFSITCITFGIYISFSRRPINDVVLPSLWQNAPFGAVHGKYAGLLAVLPSTNSGKTEVLSLALNLVVTMCTESIGFVHSVALKSALACEYRLDRNTNLRLLIAARGNRNDRRWWWTNPNGTICNMIMAMLLIASYVSSSLIFIPMQSDVSSTSPQEWWNTCIFAPPVLVLGIVLLFQAVIAVAGITQTRVLTWSSSPLETAAALLHEGRLFRRSGRCMHNVLHITTYPGPRRPSELQPSAWQSHPSIKKIIVILWCLVPVYGICCIVSTVFWYKITAPFHPNPPSWAIFPNGATAVIGYDQNVYPDYGCPPLVWLGIFIVFLVAQGALTLGLHCSEVIANVVRDETIWRAASSTTGTKTSKNPLMVVLGSWPNIGLLCAKPILRQ